MNTHTPHSEHRRLALITLYASLCSVLALQLAVQWTGGSALTASTTEVSALPGDRNLSIEDLRPYQMPSAVRNRARTEKKILSALKHAAPTPRTHQARVGR